VCIDVADPIDFRKCVVHFQKMVVHKTKLRGYVRHLLRIPASGQRAKLIEYGIPADKIYTEGEHGESLDALVRALRKGEAVGVVRVHLLAAPKSKTSDTPRRALWAAIHAIEGKGATIVEVESNRHTANVRERDAMIADAIEQITHSGRTPRKQDVPGRPRLKFTDEETETARRLWFDLRYKTNAEAFAAIRKKVPRWTLTRCYDKSNGFGPSGRGK